MPEIDQHAVSGGELPVRLRITDDLKRSRGTVFFRWLLAIPFLIWLAVWAIGAFFVAIANWIVTLVQGTPPESLHRFLARFVRYATQVYAYFNLAAEPLPGFDGKREYPIDVELPGPAEQDRWSVGFRIVLAIPALVLATVLTGSGSFVYTVFRPRGQVGTVTVIGAAAFLSWFAALARARMPRGLRDLIAYALSYAAQFWAYLLLLTDRYPSADPLTVIGPLPTRADPVRLTVDDDLRRSRLTVFFRLLLALPHLVWLSLWGVVALVAAIINWIATLVTGIAPNALHRFLAAYVRYQLHVSAFLYLVGNPFPGFVGAEGTYPVDLRVAGPERQNRWTVFFRLLLAVPAFILGAAFSWLLFAIAVLGWFAGLFTARMPLGLRNAGALALRYIAQVNAYVLLVTGAYPYSGPCIEAERPAVPEAVAVPPVA